MTSIEWSLFTFKLYISDFIELTNTCSIYRLYDWETMNRRDVRDIIKSQAQNTQLEFEQRTKDVILQFAEQGNIFIAIIRHALIYIRKMIFRT